MSTDLTRRSLTVWGLPAVMVASAAPAMAATSPSGPTCQPIAQCKLPGEGQHTKDYVILPNCTTGATVVAVRIYDDRNKRWIAATNEPEAGGWIARGFNDSRRNRQVEITTTASGVTATSVYSVAFPPC